MDEELLNRCIVLTVDEGREETRAIHERQRRARTLEGMVARQERQRILVLHQYQRQVLVVEHRGQNLRYIEVTKQDIEVANRLAHEVLGRSLDELPPQMRRLLGLLDEMATAECGRLGLDRGDFRFSRRQLRERTGDLREGS
jgi:DNA primase